MNEIDALRLIEHKNCLKLLEVYETEGSIYIITEYCDGGTLREKMEK